MKAVRSNCIGIGLVSVIIVMQSCGSNKRAVPSASRPHSVYEITLDDFIGGSTNTDQPTQASDLSSKARAVVDAAHGWLGVRYRYGGQDRSGIDCSALVMNVYSEALGIKLPRTTKTQREYSTVIKQRDLQPGDLLFFATSKNKNGISHVGLYVGNDRFIHSSSSKGVVVSSLRDKYYTSHYHSAGRVPAMELAIVPSRSNKRPSVNNDSLMLIQANLLDAILDATIDSIYSMPVDNDPNLAPGL